jgi:hypothetical protein
MSNSDSTKPNNSKRRRPNRKYELIDNQTGRTLTTASTRRAGLEAAAQYLHTYPMEKSVVSFICVENGIGARIIYRATGYALEELLEDEGYGAEWAPNDPIGDDDVLD